MESYEVRVACSMVEMATKLCVHPMQRFMCYWVAFNDIYVTVAARQGNKAQLRKKSDGSVCTRKVGNVKVPKAKAVSEREQLKSAFSEFTDTLKRDLIAHQSTSFFVSRAPIWQGQTICTDAKGQRLNGILNVGYTVDAKHPVWEPIDTQMFASYQADPSDSSCRDDLARQILDLLYTVRNNTFHAGKIGDDANDNQVLEHALPLLQMIVEFFLPVDDAP